MRKSGLRDAEAVNARVIVAVEEDGVGWRGRLQPRYYDTCSVNG